MFDAGWFYGFVFSATNCYDRCIMNPIIKRILAFCDKVNNFIYWGFNKNGNVIYSPDGKTKLGLRAGTIDKFIVWETWKIKEYDHPETKISPADTVVDIGAHIGAFTVWAANRALEGLVISYEANPENYQQLEKNVKLNNLSNVRIYNLAIAGNSGSRKLYLGDTNNGMGSFYESQTNKFVIVPAISLTEVFIDNNLNKIDVLKLDVEGAEYEILLNCPPDYLKKIKSIVFEYHDYLRNGHDHHELSGWLQKNGFGVREPKISFTNKLFGAGLMIAWREDGAGNRTSLEPIKVYHS